MADNNPSNFVSWGQQMGLTGDLEKTLYERALKAAQDEQGAAKSSLESAYGQARDANKQEVANTGTATTTLQQTGSYNDYLKHQAQAQAKATAALQGGNSVSTLMRQQLAPKAWGSAANFDQGTQALLQRQAQLEQQQSQEMTSDNASAKKERDDIAARTVAQQAEKDRRAKQVRNLINGLDADGRGADFTVNVARDGKGDYGGYDFARPARAAQQVLALGGTMEQALAVFQHWVYDVSKIGLKGDSVLRPLLTKVLKRLNGSMNPSVYASGQI